MAHEDIQKGSNFTFTITADQLQSTDPDFSVESEKNLERYGKENVENVKVGKTLY